MKIECIKDRLEEALVKASKIAGRNSTLPVLEGLYMEAKNNLLSIKATNLDLGISVSIPVRVVEPGSVVVPAQPISSLISSLTGDKNLTLSSNGQILEIGSRNVKTTLKTLSSEDFPIVDEVDGGDRFSLPVKDFISGIRAVVYSAAMGSIKPELSSICITSGNNSLVFVATDSFRLAEKKIKIKKEPNFKQVLLPQKNALEILKIFDKDGDDLSLLVNEHQISLRSENVNLTSRIIDGVFPDYKQIIPKEITSHLALLKQDLANSLKTSLVFSNSFNQLRLKLSPRKKSFEVESRNDSVGESLCRLDAVLEGEDLAINVNHRYLAECFQSINADSLKLSFGGQAKPIIVQGVGEETFLYLMMPMNEA